MFVLNHIYNLSLEKLCKVHHLMFEMEPVLILLLTVFGVDAMREPFLMWEFFIPMAPSHSQSSLASTYRKQEALKKRAYELQRIREVEHSSFTPLVFSATGGMAKEASPFYKRLASCLATKWEQHYSAVLFWLRARITFSLLRSGIQSMPDLT